MMVTDAILERRRAERREKRKEAGRRRLLDMAGPSNFYSAEFGTPDRVEFHLQIWAAWVRSGQEVDGHAHQSLGLSDGGTSKGFDEMVETEDRRCARVVDIILENLPAAHRIAIHIERGVVARVFRFGRLTYEEALSAGKEALGRELGRRGIW